MKLPCPDQVFCKSSDAASYFNGGIKCFSCDKFFKGDDIITHQDFSLSETEKYDYTVEYISTRGISSETFRRFDVKTRVNSLGEPMTHVYQYPSGGIKYRYLKDKGFSSSGSISEGGLFGQDKFPAASAKAVTITEGELDALSVYQMLGSQYPSVSVRSASQAKRDCTQAFEYLNSFDSIYLCFDNDGPGKKAAREVASLFDFNKVYEVKLDGYKDANDFLVAGKEKEFRNVWYNSKRYLPEGIVSSLSEFRDILDQHKDKPSVPYPFAGLEERTMGIRTGEFVLVTAPEGIGKTEFIRRLEHHLLVNTDSPIGTIHLEETKARQLQGLAGLELGRPAHLSTGGVSNDEIHAALVKITDGRNDRLHIYNHFGSDDPDSVVESIRFLAAVCGCKYVFLDHITMVVTGLGDDDERKTLDYLSTKLATLCHDLDFTLFCVSHVNDDGKTRGSRNISKVANVRIDLARDLVAELEEDRNKTYLVVSKNRYAGKTGPAGVLAFDINEFCLKDAKDVIFLPPIE